MTKFFSIGKAVPRVEGNAKVSGEALYAADQTVPGMIWGRVLRSPHPLSPMPYTTR